MHCLKQLDRHRDTWSAADLPQTDRDTVEIRSLEESDALAFRGLWLNALREQPHAFSLTYDEAVDQRLPDFYRRFRSEWIAGDSVILGAFEAHRLVGAVGLRRWTREKQQHKAYIWMCYVEPAFRRRGVGRRLLAAAIERAHRMAGLDQIQLSVSTESQEARALYRSCGFEPFGYEHQALKSGGEFVDLELMVLHICAPPRPFEDC